MWPPGTPSVLAGWLWVFAAAVSAVSETVVDAKVGDEVDLTPEAVSVPDVITSIMWKHGPNIAIQWDGTDTDYYRHFTERGHLNTSNGVMTITGLMRNDSGEYTPEINNIKGPPILLRVSCAVPVPTVSTSCDDEAGRCALSCDGDTTGAEPVTYTWKSDDDVVPASSEKKLVIDKEGSSSIKLFSCELKNRVSQESSLPIPNPFIVTSPPGGQPKVSTGLTVFLCLLTAVLLLVLLHRWKAGMWFFEKASMPWEADFWRKHETPNRDAAESNGTTTRQQNKHNDEETPMT